LETEADVLEVFVRINTQGTPLKRSDLVFSLLKLNWKESAESLPEFVAAINKGNSLGIDADFVIRCLMAVSEFGTKFDLEQLRNKQKIDTLKMKFPDCCAAIKATVDFVTQECKCQSSGVIGGLNTIVPFVYYLCNTHKHGIKNAQLLNVKKSFYVLAVSRPFSRYGDSRLWKFIKDELMSRAYKHDETFPYDRVVAWVKYWEKVTGFDETLIASNYVLALHLLQGLSGGAVQYHENEPHIDHIFPRSVLREKEFDESEINHFANFWILAKNKNLNKSNMPPADYFDDVHATVLKTAAIDPELLHYRSFRRFLRERRDKIIDRLKDATQISDGDFQQAARA
jgi:hypothetical protein